MAISYIPSSVVTTRADLVNGTIAVSGTTSWQTAEETLDITPYKYLLVDIQVHGAMFQSAFIPMDVFRKIPTSTPFHVSVTWDSGNLGILYFTSNGHVVVYAKTQGLQFHYMVYGFN